MLNTPQLITCLDGALARAAAALLDATHGATVCQIHKDGRVSGGAKFAEGQLVALRALRRRLLDGQPADAAWQAERATWQAAVARQQSAERPSIPWLAYSQGGVDALDALLRPDTTNACS